MYSKSFIRSSISIFLFYPLWSYFLKAGSQSTCFGISQVLVTKPVCLDSSPNFLSQILRVGSGSLLFKKLLENLVIQTDWPQVFVFLLYLVLSHPIHSYHLSYQICADNIYTTSLMGSRKAASLDTLCYYSE